MFPLRLRGFAGCCRVRLQGCKARDGNPLPLHKSKAAKVAPKWRRNDYTPVLGVRSPTEGAAGVEE